MSLLRTLVEQYTEQGQDPLQACYKAIKIGYPGLQIRFARIYGYRWAFLWGEVGEINIQPVRIQLNPNYGICIDNPTMLSTSEFEELMSTVKERCSDEHPFSW